MAEIAIFGGTFDPPTIAHEAIIEACLARDDMDEVWVMPSGDRWDKPDMQNAAVRLHMLEKVHETTFKNTGRLVLSQFEIELPYPTQTHQTVDQLCETYPEDKFWYVFGADSYHSMPSWKKGGELQQSLGMLLVRRVGYELPPAGETIKHLDIGPIVDEGISSSLVREAVRHRTSIEAYVSRGIMEVIAAKNLYGAL